MYSYCSSMYSYRCLCILIVVYVFLLLSMYSYCCVCIVIVVYVFLLFFYVFWSLSMYSYCCLCILIVVSVFLDAATLTEAFSSVVRQMPGYNSQRRGTARTLPKLLCCSMYCLFCVVLCIVCTHASQVTIGSHNTDNVLYGLYVSTFNQVCNF